MDPINNALKHLYINPLEKCNLACKICYTSKTKFVLSNEKILSFVKRYKTIQAIDSITFCGGEVFLLSDFPTLINKLTKQKVFIQIISNGTVDRLNELDHPNMINLIVSLDGIEEYHDQNRGAGNFSRSTALLQKAIDLGFHTQIFSIVTKENLSLIPRFEQEIETILGQAIPITYHPRKPLAYLSHHPISNVVGQIGNFHFLDQTEIKKLMQNKKTFPPQNFSCYQISLMADGKIYGCCEGIRPIGNLMSDSRELITAFKNRLHFCSYCAEKDFVCGLSSQVKAA